MPIEATIHTGVGDEAISRPLVPGSLVNGVPDSIVVSSGSRRARVADGSITVEVRRGEEWAAVARTVPAESTERTISVPVGRLVRSWESPRGEVILEWADSNDGRTIITRATFSESEPWIEISAECAVVGDRTLSRFDVTWEFLSSPDNGIRPDFLYSPCLIPNEGEVIGQHMFRSPAAIAQHGDVALSLEPALESIERDPPMGAFLELLSPKGRHRFTTLSYGVAAYRVTRHVYFTTNEVPPARLTDTAVRFTCALRVETGVPERRGHQAVVRAMWDAHGRKWLSDVQPQVLPFQSYYDYAYDYADAHLWREMELDGRRIGAMTISREYAGDVWFQAWFNQLRTAWGLYWWARRVGDEERMSKALATRDLVLSAPQDRGLFPTIAVFGEKDGEPTLRWVASTLQGGGPDLYHLVDSSLVATWLLRWHTELVADERTVSFCSAYAEALREHQRRDGSWPEYLNVRNHECATEYDLPGAAKACDSGYVKGMVEHWGTHRLDRSAESAANALFLAEYSRVIGGEEGKRSLGAAKLGAEFLKNDVIPAHKWFDYETFFSCSPKSLDFYDRRSNQHPQNTLSMSWAAESFRVLAEITGDDEYRELAISLTDYLCLYQQVWSPPFLSFYGFGGFGVMNTDGEWNDARQAIFADELAAMYQLTGRREYLERAVAATRASFATAYIPENAVICPKIYTRTPTGYADENYAHGGHDTPAGPTSLDWGIGSGVTAAARLLHWFGDAWVDSEEGWAVGVDGITASCAEESIGNVARLHSPVRSLERAEIVEKDDMRAPVEHWPERTVVIVTKAGGKAPRRAVVGDREIGGETG